MHIGIFEMIIFALQEGIIEHTTNKCHVVPLMLNLVAVSVT